MTVKNRKEIDLPVALIKGYRYSFDLLNRTFAGWNRPNTSKNWQRFFSNEGHYLGPLNELEPLFAIYRLLAVIDPKAPHVWLWWVWDVDNKIRPAFRGTASSGPEAKSRALGAIDEVRKELSRSL